MLDAGSGSANLTALGGTVTVGRKAQGSRNGAATRERILEASRTLFNANGVERTAVMKIASAVEISPGNLTYHFNTKSDIVREIALRLESGMHDNLNRMQAPFAPREVVERLSDLFTVLWHYRFLFNSGPFFYISDPESAEIYQKIDDDLHAIMADYLMHVVESGFVKSPGGPTEIRLFSDNIIAVWQQWLLAHSMRAPYDDVPMPAAIRDVIARHVAVMAPFLTATYADALRSEADRQLGPHDLRPLPDPSIRMSWRLAKPTLAA